jgi:CubicO group peptidase (beta-lactamase class C family)/DNA-binding PadR family transcriptional regulator
VLGLIWERQPCTVYQLRKVFLASSNPSWSGSAGAVYPLVERLRRDGLIDRQPGRQGRRKSRLYSITRDGRARLRDWLRRAVDPIATGAPPDALRTRVPFLGALSPRGRLDLMLAAREQVSSRLESQRRMLESDSLDPIDELLLRGAAAAQESRVAWLDEVVARLGAALSPTPEAPRPGFGSGHASARPRTRGRARRVASALLAVSIAAGASAASPPSAEQPRNELPSEEVERILESLRAEHDVPALVAVVSDRHGVIGAGAVGVRRVGGNSRIEAGDRFHLGSIAKPITASAIAALVEAGTLAWDSRLLDVVPELGSGARADYAAVTLRQLLSHTAGIQPFEEDEEFVRVPTISGSPRERRLAFARWLSTLEPAAPPGTAHVYSNAGYAVAAAMAERAADDDFERIVRRVIFDPLGMTSASAGAGRAISADEPWGHRRSGRSWEARDPRLEVPFAALIRPAGDFRMTLFDLAAFGRAHLRGLQGEDGFLAAETIGTLHTEVLDGYALGWNVRDRFDSHLGGLEGMHTALLFVDKEAGRVYSLAVNAEIDDTSIFGRAISRLRRLPVDADRSTQIPPTD